MLEQIVISFVTLSGLMIAWYGLQRWTHRGKNDPTCDYLEGRWGCGDCAIADRCALPHKTPQ